MAGPPDPSTLQGSPLLAAVMDGTRQFARAVAADVHELGGVTAAVVPACPERSVLNSVCYERQEQLAPKLDELAAIYHAGAIHAWTVWVPSPDREAAAALKAAGHVLDAAPEAMGMVFDSCERPSFSYRWTRHCDPAVVGALNDRAYGYDGSFQRALTGMDAEACRFYAAYVDGAPASCCLTVDHDEDCHMTLVATLPEARGRGLAGALMAQALADANERGLVSSTLVATKMGRTVYDRLGYSALGPVEMWERRLV
jgi:ribosomal protein S18 acetylase RimI-like enzyme